MKLKLGLAGIVFLNFLPIENYAQKNKAILVIDVPENKTKREIENICKVIKYNPQCPVFMISYTNPEFNEKILNSAGANAVKIIKKYQSAFQKTFLKDSLYKKGIDTILVSGFAWDYCVKNTAEDAIKEKFAVISSPKLMYGESKFNGKAAKFYKSKTIFCNSIKKVNRALK